MVPAVIPISLDNLKISLEILSFAKEIQIDVVDGIFVENISWPYKPKGDISKIKDLIQKFNIEIDLMAKNPIDDAEKWLEIGVASLVFHLESLEKPEEIFELKKNYNFNLGISINNTTHLEKIYPFLSQVDYVQLMGIAEIGSQNQPFDNSVLEKIIILKSLYPEIIISVDGSVNLETIKILKETGVDRFVVGSAILKSANPEKSYDELLKIIEN